MYDRTRTLAIAKGWRDFWWSHFLVKQLFITRSKVIGNNAIRQSTYDFLSVFIVTISQSCTVSEVVAFLYHTSQPVSFNSRPCLLIVTIMKFDHIFADNRDRMLYIPRHWIQRCFTQLKFRTFSRTFLR